MQKNVNELRKNGNREQLEIRQIGKVFKEENEINEREIERKIDKYIKSNNEKYFQKILMYKNM